jgi:hypothetical protein
MPTLSLAEALRAAANIIDGRTPTADGPSPNQLRALSVRAERLETEQAVLLNAIKAGLQVLQDVDDSQQPGTAAWLWVNRATEIIEDHTKNKAGRNGQ